MYQIYFLLILCSVFNQVFCYNILVVVTAGSKSHFNLGKGISDTLHSYGHNITFIHSMHDYNLPYREISLDIGKTVENTIPVQESSGNFFSPYLRIYNIIDTLTPVMVNNVLGHEKIIKFMANEDEKFDAVIVDYLMNDLFAAFGVKYDCPVIMLSTVSMMSWIARHTGNPLSPATVANVYSECAPEMTFVDRFENTLWTILMETMEYTVCKKHQEPVYRKYFPEIAAQVSYSEVIRKISLVLSNTHPSIGSVRPMLPNVIEIGGYHIGDVPPLPKEFQDIMDNSKNGVVYFSLGSVTNTSSIPDNIKLALMRSFEKLDMTVIFKYPTVLPNKPDNVILKKWVPQTSILAHPKLKLFITHGGLLSLMEATSAGVPLISIPVFADQFYNSKIIQSKKIGIYLNMHKITEESFDWALNEILSNSIFRENMKKQQKLFKDRPIPPRELINYYTEYVIRNDGAKHLSAPYVNLFGSLLLDVVAVLLIPPSIISIAIVYIFKKVCNSRKKQTQTSKKKKQN